MKNKCDWPGCEKKSLCTSGNVDGAFVCRDHFDITNGKEFIELSPEEIECMVMMAQKAQNRRNENSA